MLFLVRRYDGPAQPHNVYETVEAESAKEAAEQVCGEPLTEQERPARLRATVHTKPPGGHPVPFYALA